MKPIKAIESPDEIGAGPTGRGWRLPPRACQAVAPDAAALDPVQAINGLLVAIAADRHRDRPDRLAQQRSQIFGQHLSGGKLLAPVNDRNAKRYRHQAILSCGSVVAQASAQVLATPPSSDIMSDQS